MSNKVAIVTDSTAYLPTEQIQQLNITVTPLSVIWGEQVQRDGVDILPNEFYERLAHSKVMPTTSQVTPAVMHSTFQSLLEQGYDVLGMFISSKISGTVQSAIQAVDMLSTGADKVAIVDSLATTMALGLPVITTARAAQAGANLECQSSPNMHENSGVLFVVETLEFLRRGGRIGGGQAMLGTLLNIKPILELRDGRIEARQGPHRQAIQRAWNWLPHQRPGADPPRGHPPQC
jgi:DegV family protein with EDD domain